MSVNICTWKKDGQCRQEVKWQCDFVKLSESETGDYEYITELTSYCDEHMKEFRGRRDACNIRPYIRLKTDDFWKELDDGL